MDFLDFENRNVRSVDPRCPSLFRVLAVTWYKNVFPDFPMALTLDHRQLGPQRAKQAAIATLMMMPH